MHQLIDHMHDTFNISETLKDMHSHACTSVAYIPVQFNRWEYMLVWIEYACMYGYIPPTSVQESTYWYVWHIVSTSQHVFPQWIQPLEVFPDAGAGGHQHILVHTNTSSLGSAGVWQGCASLVG